MLCRRYADPGYRELVEGICREAGFTPRVLQAVEQKQTAAIGEPEIGSENPPLKER